MPENKLVVPFLSAGNFAIGMGAFVVIGMLNPMAEGLGLSASEAGWVMTVYALSYAVGSPVGVSLTGARSRRVVLTVGLFVFGLASALSALAPSAVWLFGARVLAAGGAGLYTPVAASVAATASAPENRGKALAGVFFGLTLAQVLGIPAGSFIAYTFGWQAVFVFVAGLSVFCAVMVWWVVPRGLAFQPTTLATLGETLVDWRAMLGVFYTVSIMGAVYIVYAYLAPLLFKGMGYGRDGLTIVLLVFGAGAVVGNVLGGGLTDRIGAGRTLVLITLAQVVLMPFFSYLPLPEVVLLVLVFVWSVFGWSFMVPQQTRLVAFSPERQSVLLALNAAAIYIGASIGTTIGGVVIDTLSISTLGLAGGLGGGVALVYLMGSERVFRKAAAENGRR